MGTGFDHALLGGVASTVLSLALICVRVVLSVGLFAHSLPRRPHCAVRCVGLGGMVLLGFGTFLALAGAIGPVSTTAGYLITFGVFSLILGVCVTALLWLCDTSVWVALFCVTAGYTMENLATGCTELVASLMRAGGLDPSFLPVYLANDVVSMGLVYGTCYLLLTRRIDHEGLVQMENHGMLLMMPVVSVTVIGFDVLVKSMESSGIALAYTAALRLLHGVACVAVLWIEYQMLYRARADLDRATAARLLAERERQYQLSRETIEAINVKCHDLKHQIRALASGGAAVDGAVLDDLARDISMYDSSVKTGNEALDTILTEKRLVCEGRGITLTCIADGPALAGVAAADLYALFGNALDNAIEAVSALDDPARRSISVVVRRALGCASIHVENFYAGARRFEGGLPVTTKADRAAHGFGTRSMRAIAERYGGSFSAVAEDGVFKLDVMVPVR